MSSPYTPTEAKSRQTFLALMWGLSYPGRIQTLPVESYPSNFVAIGEALLDLETSFFSPDQALAVALRKSTARPQPPDIAAYHFYPKVGPDHLDTINVITVGDMNFPDRGGTLVVGCQIGSGTPLRLTGPGVEAANHIEIGGLTDDFWEARAAHIRYPLGWDIFLVDRSRVIGIPRTTQISY